MSARRKDRQPLGALFFQVAEHGLKALDDKRNKQRLERLDPETRTLADAAIREIINTRVLRKQAEKQQRPPRKASR
jgi:hypothetical protein